MKKAHPVRLSLRKLFIAMLAVGPIAILPAPLLAAVPPTMPVPFTVINGAVTYTGVGNFATISAATDRAIVSWMPGLFNIQQGDQFSFQVPSGGGILNKVGYGINGSTTTTQDNAIINGSLQSNGRVFILANGNISVGGGASISALGGLFLSTLLEPDNFNFSALGNLAFTGAPAALPGGAIQIGGSNAAQGTPNTGLVSVTGNIGVWGGTVAINNILVTGDMIVNQRTASAPLLLTGANGPTTVNGSLAVTTNNGAVNQTPLQALTVGVGAVSSVASFNTNGNVAVTLNTNVANDFLTVTGNTGSLLISDANNVIIGASTLGTALGVSAVNNITTSGAVTVAAGGTVTLASTGAGNVTFANNSTTNGGTLAASTVVGNVTVATAGALTTGAITAGTGGTGIASIGSTGATTIAGAILAGNATVSGTSVTSTGGSVNSSGAAATFTATAGSIVLPAVTAPSVNATATGGSISQFGASVITTNSVAATSTFNTGGLGAISLTNSNAFANQVITSNGTNVSLTNTGHLTLGATQASGSVTINTVPSALGAGNVTLGTGFGTAAVGLTVAGGLNITTNASAVIEDNAVDNSVFGAVTINTTASAGQSVYIIPLATGGVGYTAVPTITISGGGGTGATATATANTTTGLVTGITVTALGTGFTSAPTIAFSASGSSTAATVGAVQIIPTTADVFFLSAQEGRLGSGFFGQWNITGLTVEVSENTTVNLGNIVAYNTFRANSTAGDVLVNGNINVFAALNRGTAATGTNGTTNVSNSALGLRATSGAITEAGAGVINMLNGGTASFQSSNSFGANLSNASNVFAGAVQFSQGLNNIVVSSSNFTLASTTCVVAGGSSTNITTVGPAGNNRITVLGNFATTRANSGGDIVVGAVTAGNLVLTAADATATSITQNAAFGQLNGTLTVTSPGNVVLNNVGNNMTGSLVLANQVGDTTVFSTRNLTASGNSTGNLTVAAGTSSTNSFSNAWNVILGNLNVRNLTAAALNGNTTVAGLVVAPTGVALTILGGGTGYTANPTVTFVGGGGSGATATTTRTGTVVTGITITNPGSGYTSLPTIAFSTNASTIPATAALSGAIMATGNPLGGNAIAGDSGNITQQNANARIHTEGTADLVTFNGNILLGNNGNSFGRVQASTGGVTGLVGTSNITIVEDPSLRVGNIATSGNVSLTSRFGTILEDGNAPVNITANGATGIVLSAPAGSIQLGNQTGLTTGNIATVSMNAAGSAQIASAGNLVLGATKANSLVVTANSIAQSAPLNIFGSSSFTATNAAAPATSGGITLTDSANNFGPVTLNVTGTNSSVAISEGSTLNLRSASLSPTVNSNGTFTATSIGGDIIDTGLGGVKLGGSAPLGVPVTGLGVVTLTATNGNIIIDDPTSDVLTTGGVAFNARNVTLSVLGSPGISLVLGAAGTASVATGNLTASSALGNIGNAGAFSVGGLATFQTGTGNITINQPNVGFGSLRFIGNQVNISEGGNMDILTGSTAFGAAQLVSGGSITIVQGEPNTTVTFGSSVAFQATGNITLRQTQAVGFLTLIHTGTANLSALSKATDLNGRDPIDLGTGPGPASDPVNLGPKP